MVLSRSYFTAEVVHESTVCNCMLSAPFSCDYIYVVYHKTGEMLDLSVVHPLVLLIPDDVRLP